MTNIFYFLGYKFIGFLPVQQKYQRNSGNKREDTYSDKRSISKMINPSKNYYVFRKPQKVMKKKIHKNKYIPFPTPSSKSSAHSKAGS